MYRKSEMKDIDYLYRLMCELENKNLSYESFARIYKKQLLNENMYCLVYETNNQIVAMLNMRFEYQLHHCEKIAEVMEFIVSDQYRSQGIGKAMFNQAIEIAKDNDCAQIELATNQLRKDAHRFYEREGMSNFHYKFSMRLDGIEFSDNKIGN